jgi:hypothetical protein
MPTFTVLCRIDAYVDYVAEVEAEDADQAAWLARETHEDYAWRREQTAEFDDRFYVTLDRDGEEIESSHIGDM